MFLKNVSQLSPTSLKNRYLLLSCVDFDLKKIKCYLYQLKEERYMRPYIGVTGFTDRNQVETALSEFLGADSVGEHMLMVGILVSHKTLRGETNKFPARYPAISTISDLLVSSSQVLNLVHFNTHTQNFCEELEIVAQHAGPNLDGFQLNLCWPDPTEIYAYKNKHHPSTIVLQIGGRAFAQIGLDPSKLTDVLERNYGDLIDYILLDPSGGTGQQMNIHKTNEYLDEIYSKGLQNKFGIGIAGGLSSENISILQPLVDKYDNLSIDAEGRLRIPENDLMNLSEVQRFIQASKDLLIKPTNSMVLCDGCNVKAPHEHRCHGSGPITVHGDRKEMACECIPCNNPPSAEKLQEWADAGYPEDFVF